MAERPMTAVAGKLLRAMTVVALGMIIMKLVGPKLKTTMERRFAEAPDDFPPKWMYTNVSAIRDNTERILAALEREVVPA